MNEVKDMFGLRELSHSEANHSSVNFFAIQHAEDIHGAIQELMKRQKSLMMKSCNIICEHFL